MSEPGAMRTRVAPSSPPSRAVVTIVSRGCSKRRFSMGRLFPLNSAKALHQQLLMRFGFAGTSAVAQFAIVFALGEIHAPIGLGEKLFGVNTILWIVRLTNAQRKQIVATHLNAG